MKMIKHKHKPKSRISRVNGISRTKPKVKRNEVIKMNVAIEKPTIMGPMARMKKMSLEAMKEKGLTYKDVIKMIGIEKYEED